MIHYDNIVRNYDIIKGYCDIITRPCDIYDIIIRNNASARYHAFHRKIMSTNLFELMEMTL